MTLDTIKSEVEKVLRAHLAPSVIREVLVLSEADSDGEAILRIQVVIDRNGPELNAEKLFFATGVVRSALERVDEKRFPLLSFPSSDEIPGVAA